MSIIYLDNAATSFPKPASVIEESRRCLLKYCGNPGRSAHPLSLRAAEKIYEARECVAEFFGCSHPENVVFTYNATYALNIAIKSLIPDNSHVIISDVEHNAVLRPICALSEKGIEYSKYNSSGNVGENIKRLIRHNTSAIISTLKSNVTGLEIDYRVLSDIATTHGIILILDASQYAGHKDINLSKIKCDAFCAPAHKGLLGMQGCGFAIFGSNTRNRSIFEGGSGSDSQSTEMPYTLPEGHEAGTVATPAIVALMSGIKYINAIGIDRVNGHISDLSNKVADSLEKISGIKLYYDGSGIISFNLKNVPSSTVADLLAKNKICTRSGLHCAPLAHAKIGTLERGAVRLSFSINNTEREAHKTVKVIRNIANIL